MSLVRRVARPALSSIFVLGGADSMRDPGPRVKTGGEVLESIGKQVEGYGLPSDPETLVRVNGAVMVGAGLLLAAGKAPRLSALVLAGTLVPTTLAGHAFWKQPDKALKAQQLNHFAKNVSLLGGLLLAVVDTAGEPSLGWRARRAAKGATRLSRTARREIAQVAEAAGDAARNAAAALPDLSS